jgi:hypothetical protein
VLKKNRKPRTRKGMVLYLGLAKAGLKSIAPVLIDAVSNTAKKKFRNGSEKKN